jgi:hypothetical protein
MRIIDFTKPRSCLFFGWTSNTSTPYPQNLMEDIDETEANLQPKERGTSA